MIYVLWIIAEKEERNVKNQHPKSYDEENSTDTSKLSSADTANRITDSRKFIAKPVPAPRTSLEIQTRFLQEDSTPKKPVIPEKPSTLPRPVSCSFKSFKTSDPSDIIKIDVRICYVYQGI